MMHVLERRQLVAASLEEVFPFFADPANLARITPPWLGFRIVNADTVRMRAGERIEYRVSPLGFPQKWVSEITSYDPPHGFVDEQRVGPYRRWHHEHRFSATSAGTELVDRVEYELPLGPLGDLAHAVFVRRQLEAIFRHRARVTGEMFGAVE